MNHSEKNGNQDTRGNRHFPFARILAELIAAHADQNQRSQHDHADHKITDESQPLIQCHLLDGGSIQLPRHCQHDADGHALEIPGEARDGVGVVLGDLQFFHQCLRQRTQTHKAAGIKFQRLRESGLQTQPAQGFGGKQDFIDVVRLHAEDGVDFVTLHCGITRKTIEQIRKHKRKMNIVSRGGSLVFAWMCMTGEENPFYEYYDEILEICREHDVTISLGDACRPGCLADASDVCQIEELVRLGELTKRAWARDVQVMVEGPGHMPMDQIAANMKIQQTICMGAPFYVLGPLVTDIAPGYDHITSAIGGAIAAQNGAAFLCYVTPAEHLALPNVEDVKQGIIASKIAAHAADIAKGVRGAREIDDKMADARRVLDWDAQWECAIDPETAKQIREDRKPEHEDTCSMCGKFCAVRSMNKALAGEYIDIL